MTFEHVTFNPIWILVLLFVLIFIAVPWLIGKILIKKFGKPKAGEYILSKSTISIYFFSTIVSFVALVMAQMSINFVDKGEISLYESDGKVVLQGKGLHVGNPFTEVYYLKKEIVLECRWGKTKNIIGEVSGRPEVCRVATLDVEKFMSRVKTLNFLSHTNAHYRANTEKLYKELPELFSVREVVRE